MLNKKEGGLRTQGYFKKSFEDKPLISIVTVVLNGEKYLEETIQSVLNQTYDNVEYIIVDGGSSDGTLDIIKKYEEVIDYWVSEKDKGIYDAMNKGIKIVTSNSFFMFLNCGDFFKANNILSKLGIRISDEIVYGGVSYIYKNGTFKTDRIKMINSFNNLIVHSIPHQAFFCKKDDIRYFNLKYKVVADSYMMLELYKNKQFRFIDLLVSNVRIGGYSSNFKQLYFERLSMVKEFTNTLQFYKYAIIFNIENFHKLIKWQILLQNAIILIKNMISKIFNTSKYTNNRAKND